MHDDGLHAATTRRVDGSAIEVHRHLGPGLLESVYEAALSLELSDAGLPFERQVGIPLHYKGRLIGERRPDLVVDGAVIVEVKSVEQLAPIHMAQMLTYLRVSGLRVGLVLNFNSTMLKEGIRRIVL